jgi:soluble lytic murein transglycosylase-like protein
VVLKQFFLIAVLLAPPLAHAGSKIYSYVDETGTHHYTDVPDNNRYRLVTLSWQERARSGDRYDPHWTARAREFDAIIERAARSASIEANLLRAVIVVESGFNPHARSPRGAIGLMQLMPATASRFGVSDLDDPRENIRAGAAYLKFLMNRFGQNMHLALAGYNAGEQAVDRHGGRIPPYAETLEYVPKVLHIYRTLADNGPAPQIAALDR